MEVKFQERVSTQERRVWQIVTCVKAVCLQIRSLIHRTEATRETQVSIDKNCLHRNCHTETLTDLHSLLLLELLRLAVPHQLVDQVPGHQPCRIVASHLTITPPI